MGALIPTSRFTLLSPGSSDTEAEDWGGAPDPITGYSETGITVDGHLSAPSGAAAFSPEGSTAAYTYTLICEPCDMVENMRVRDESDGQVYSVASVITRRGVFLPSTQAILTRTQATS